MKSPSWMIVKTQFAKHSDGQVYVTIRVRRWHPGFWWFVIRALWQNWWSK